MHSMKFTSNHALEILSKLNTERKTTTALCDVTIKVGSEGFPAHRCVLSAFSDFYARMFLSEMKEKYEPEVSIKGLSSEIMDLIMDFIYTCKINLTNENVFELLAASEQLQIPYIKDYCALLLHKIANRSNCIHIFMCARLYQLKNVVQKAEKILFENFESIVKEEQFNLLELEDVTALVKSNGQHVKEEDLYLALVAWVKHDRNQREQYFCRLFGNLSLCKLSKAFLKKVLVHECLVADCLDCSKALMKAVLEHAPEQQDADSQSSFVVMGGEGDEVTDIVTYNLMEKQCLIEQPFLHRKLPFGHTGASAVCIEKTVFLMGGGESLTEIIDTVKSFNAENKLSPWVKQPKMLKKRQYFSSAVINELIYVSGGLKPNAGSTASCEQFDTMSKVWSGMYNMIQERAFHGMVALNRKLYVAGGFGGGKRLSSAECYDPCSKRWKFVASMKEKRNELTLVVLNNRLFAIGGYNGQNRLSSMEIYNPLTDSWVNGAPLNISRSGACACVMKGKIYVVGGKNEQGPVLSVEVYDPALGNWEINCKLATPRMYSSIVTV